MPLAPLAVTAALVAGQPSDKVWPADCAMHFEPGDTLSHNGASAQIIGYFDRVVHHTGLRRRHSVFAITDRPDRAVVLDQGKALAALIDTSGQNVARYFEGAAILDESALGTAPFKGLIKQAPTKDTAIIACNA
ncbi:MAG: hypothetical protein AAF692_05185 [Pseudomonadota bacterium]